eukprot:5090056-Pyramimonas_sp.AAC.1
MDQQVGGKTDGKLASFQFSPTSLTARLAAYGLHGACTEPSISSSVSLRNILESNRLATYCQAPLFCSFCGSRERLARATLRAKTVSPAEPQSTHKRYVRGHNTRRIDKTDQ